MSQVEYYFHWTQFKPIVDRMKSMVSVRDWAFKMVDDECKRIWDHKDMRLRRWWHGGSMESYIRDKTWYSGYEAKILFIIWYCNKRDVPHFRIGNECREIDYRDVITMESLAQAIFEFETAIDNDVIYMKVDTEAVRSLMKLADKLAEDYEIWGVPKLETFQDDT